MLIHKDFAVVDFVIFLKINQNPKAKDKWDVFYRVIISLQHYLSWHMKETGKKIPKGIVIIIILTIISGIILLTMSIFSFIVLISHGPLALMGPAFLLILGTTSILVSFGLYKRKSWSWTLLLILSAFGAAGYLLNMVNGNVFSIFGLVVNAVIIYYLYRPYVRKYFARPNK
jgi:hypothetical protein